MVGPPLQQLVLQSQFGEIAQSARVVLLRVATDDVVGLLLSLVNAEPLKTLFALGGFLGCHVGEVDASQVGWYSCALRVLVKRGQFKAGLVLFRITVHAWRLIEIIASALHFREIAIETAHIFRVALDGEVIIVLVLLAVVEAVVEIAGLAV